MKRNLITLFGVIAILAGVVVVRSVFEVSPKTDAEILEAEEAKTQLEEAAAITDTAESHEGHSHADGEDHDHGEDNAEAVMAAATTDSKSAPATEDAPASPAAAAVPAPSAGIEAFEEIAEWPETMPDVFRVKFETTTGPYVIEVTKDWAPIGAERFYELCKVGFFNEAGYFRVIHGFMVQFGLAADPKLTAQFKVKNLQDEPVRKSNQRGKITFAKSGAPNSRTTQVFINYGNNANLDNMGFAPFGEVIFGMEAIEAITDEYGERPEQGAITDQGNAYLKAKFPNLDYINKVTLVK